jgi:hypothetical protein
MAIRSGKNRMVNPHASQLQGDAKTTTIQPDQSDYLAQFLINGTPSERDWNSPEEFRKFVKAYPGKIPRLNATKVLTARDQYGMKGFHA